MSKLFTTLATSALVTLLLGCPPGPSKTGKTSPVATKTNQGPQGKKITSVKDLDRKVNDYLSSAGREKDPSQRWQYENQAIAAVVDSEVSYKEGKEVYARVVKNTQTYFKWELSLPPKKRGWLGIPRRLYQLARLEEKIGSESGAAHVVKEINNMFNEQSGMDTDEFRERYDHSISDSMTNAVMDHHRKNHPTAKKR